MTNDELLNIVEQEEANCIGVSSGELSEQRRKAMAYYYGQPYGNEVEGRSQVVTSEVLDAVEGVMPSLMSIFTASDEVVRFEPQGPEDEAAAAQATDYVNYIFSRSNNGFLVLYCLFKDALLQKNGFCKAYWEEYEDYTKEKYAGLTEEEFLMLAQGDEVEVLEHTKNPDGSHDAVFRKKSKQGKICLDPIPPEEVLISRDTPNELGKARFVEHRRKVTISKLREMGFEVDSSLTDQESTAEYNAERLERTNYDDSGSNQNDDNALDPAMKEVWVCEAYLKVDFDGDGVAEGRKITKVGKRVLDNVEYDSCAIVTGTPILMPHKVYGMSLADLVMDLQLIKSTITRQLLDNAYLANNGRYEALDGMVNMDDLLTNRPGGVVRVKAIGSVKRIETPLLGQPAFQLLEYFDVVKENRVGVTRYNQGLDADSLNKTAHGIERIMGAAQQRIELIARILAETCLKELFWKILELISKHQNKPQVVKLRNQWVTVDPREWKNKFNMTVTVGLGTGSQQATLQSAQLIMASQFEMLKAGLGDAVVTPENIYNAGKLLAKAAFPKHGDQLFTNPAQAQPKPPQPDPEMLKLQFADKKLMVGDKQKRDKMAMDYDLKMKEMGKEVGIAQQDRQADQVSQAVQMMHEGRKTAADKAHEVMMRSADMRHEAGMRGADMQHEVGMRGADMQHEAKMSQPEGASGGQSPSGGASTSKPESARIVFESPPVHLEQNEGLMALADAMREMMGQMAKMQEAIIQKPVVKETKVIRDAKGNMVGAETVETPVGA